MDGSLNDGTRKSFLPCVAPCQGFCHIKENIPKIGTEKKVHCCDRLGYVVHGPSELSVGGIWRVSNTGLEKSLDT